MNVSPYAESGVGLPVAFFRRAAWWMVGSLLFGAVVGWAVSLARPEVYHGEAYIAPPLANGVPAVDIEAYASRANSMGFAARMQRESGLRHPASEWRAAVQVATDGPDVVVLVEHRDSRAAAAMVQYAQRAVVADLNQLYRESHDLARELVAKIRTQIVAAEEAAAADPGARSTEAEIRRGSMALLYRVLYDLQVTVLPATPATTVLVVEPARTGRRRLAFATGGATLAGAIALAVTIVIGYATAGRYRSR